MSLNVPTEVLSEVISACTGNKLSLVITADPASTSPKITVHYQISKGERSWSTPRSMVNTNFEPTVILTGPPTTVQGALSTTSMALQTSRVLETLAKRAANTGLNPSRTDAISRAERALHEAAYAIDHINVDQSSASWFTGDWLQEGQSEHRVTNEAATALTLSLAYIMHNGDDVQRPYAEQMIQLLSEGMAGGEMPALTSWLESRESRPLPSDLGLEETTLDELPQTYTMTGYAFVAQDFGDFANVFGFEIEGGIIPPPT